MNSPRKSPVLWAAAGATLTLMLGTGPAWGQKRCSEFELVGKPTTMTRANGAPVYVEAPTFADTPGGLALAGSPTFLWWSSHAFVDSSVSGVILVEYAKHSVGVVRAPNGVASDLPRPDSAKWGRDFRFLNVAPSPILFWTTERDTVKRTMLSSEIVWSARLTDGRWSAPTRVIRTDAIQWNPSTATTLTVGGVPTVVSAGFDDSQSVKRGGFFGAHLIGDKWQLSWVYTRLPPGYLDAVDDGAGNTVVAMISGILDDSLGQIVNGVYVAREHEGKWDSPVLVYRFPGNDFGHLVKMGTSSDGALHIVWMEAAGSIFKMNAIRHLVSRDRGVHWFETARMALDGEYEDLFALSRPGRPLLIASRSLDRNRVTVWAWRASGWQRVADIPSTAFARVTMEWTGDRVLVAWPEASPLGKPISDDMWPVLVTAELLCR